MYSALAGACEYSIAKGSKKGKAVETPQSRKEVGFMSEKEKRIMETFALIIPKLSEADKSYLLGLGEGMAIKVDAQNKETVAAVE